MENLTDYQKQLMLFQMLIHQRRYTISKRLLIEQKISTLDIILHKQKTPSITHYR